MDHDLRMKYVLQENYIQSQNIKKIACVVSRFGKPVEGTVYINKITKGALCDAVHTVYQDITYSRFHGTRVNVLLHQQKIKDLFIMILTKLKNTEHHIVQYHTPNYSQIRQ